MKGKAGGGSVRARIQASSLNYTKTKTGHVDGSYFPLDSNGKARAVSSIFSRHLPGDEKTYEGTIPCHALTPLGHAIGCPEPIARYHRHAHRRQGECEPYSDTCHLVYSGHNFVGSEMHWLPVLYLQKWWLSLQNNNSTGGTNTNDFITPLWDKLLPNHTWCAAKGSSRLVHAKTYKSDYEECSIPLQHEVDTKALVTLNDQLSTNNDTQVITSWAPLYASLPLLRVTVMRDPFSWLISKYFWHLSKEDIKDGSTCDEIEKAVERHLGNARSHKVQMDNSGPGWINRMCLGYIMYLCGEDCIVRYAAGTATLTDLELQAEGNLRQSFAVVGILEEVDTFYEMLTARVQYMNTSLNPHVRGAKHTTGSSPEIVKCKARFQDINIQAKLLELSPELRALNRLYQVGKEVNRFQLKELQECSSTT